MKQSAIATERPRYIKVNARDNVAIVVNDFGLSAGTRFSCGLELRGFVPQGHKTALVDVAENKPILRYAEIIGYAASPIAAGEWVDEARIRMPEAPSLDALDIATAVPAPQPRLEGDTFEGYRNLDGSVGTKNILGISTSVQCVKGTLEYAVKRIRAESCRNTPTSTTLSPSRTPMDAVLPSMRRTRSYPSVPCKISLSIRISAARSLPGANWHAAGRT